MVLDSKIVDNIKIIESIMFYHEVIETLEFDDLQNKETLNFFINIVNVKLKEILGNDIYNEYIELIDNN